MAGGWDHWHGLDVDCSLRRLSTARKDPSNRGLPKDPALASLLSPWLLRACGLRDMAWACHSQIPPHVIELLPTRIPTVPTAHAPLSSLATGDQNWALPTSPNLCIVSALYLRLDDKQRLLRRASLYERGWRASPSLLEAARLGRPRLVRLSPQQPCLQVIGSPGTRAP